MCYKVEMTEALFILVALLAFAAGYYARSLKIRWPRGEEPLDLGGHG